MPESVTGLGISGKWNEIVGNFTHACDDTLTGGKSGVSALTSQHRRDNAFSLNAALGLPTADTKETTTKETSSEGLRRSNRQIRYRA